MYLVRAKLCPSYHSLAPVQKPGHYSVEARGAVGDLKNISVETRMSHTAFQNRSCNDRVNRTVEEVIIVDNHDGSESYLNL